MKFKGCLALAGAITVSTALSLILATPRQGFADDQSAPSQDQIIPDDGVRIQRVVLAELPQNARHVTFSADDNRAAYIDSKAGKEAVVVNGKPGPLFDKILFPDAYDESVFSPDSLRMAYSAKRGDKYTMIVDEKEGPTYDEIGEYHFSPDSKRLAYVARRGNTEFLVVDGKDGPAFDKVSKCIFSQDSSHLLYWAKQDGKQFFVLDGVKGPQYSNIKEPKLSPDGKRLAFVEDLGDRERIIIDGKAQPVFTRIGELYFSPDSSHLAYNAEQNNKWLAVVDGVQGPPFDNIQDICFSPDSKRWAYTGDRGKKSQAVIDGTAGPAFDVVDGSSMKFSPDSKHFVYGASTFASDEVRSIVHDGKQVTQAQGAQFNPKDSGLVYRHDDQATSWRLVMSDKEVPGQVPIYAIGFAPTGNHWAGVTEVFGSQRNAKPKFAVILDGEAGPSFDKIFPEKDVYTFASPNFNADGSVYFGAIDGDQALRVVLKPARNAP